MDDQTNDEAAQEVNEATQEQTEQVQDQSAQDQASGAAVSGEIEIGGQRFKDVESLKKAYAEQMKGFTQASQKHARELKELQAVRQWMDSLGPEGRLKATEFIRGGSKAAPKATPEPAPSEMKSGPLDLSEVYDRLDRQEALNELVLFTRAHGDLTDDQLREIASKADEYLERGERRSLEEIYRFMYFDRRAQLAEAKAASKAEERIAKNREATTLGTGAPIQKKSQGTRYGDLKKPSEKRDFIKSLIRKAGIKFD